MRVYRLLLALYPRAFRRDYGPQMLQLFGDQRRDLGARVWLRVGPDLIKTVPSQRIEAVMASVNSGGRVAAVVFVVLAGVVVVLGLGGPLVLFVLLAIAAVAFGQRRLVASMRRGGRAPLRHAVTQTWWAPIAALIGGAELFFGVGTIFEASNWGGRIFGTAALVACGSGMLVGLMRRPYARDAGNALILITTIPALLFFWLVVPTVLALVVWVGVFTSGFRDEEVAPA